MARSLEKLPPVLIWNPLRDTIRSTQQGVKRFLTTREGEPMARPGEVIESPVLRDRIVFRQTARETGGTLLQFEDWHQPGAPGPIEHLHPRQEERLEVLQGSMIVRVGGREEHLTVGQHVVIPPGVPHTFRNTSDGELCALTDFRPAMQLERFFETIFGLARDGKTDKDGVPSFLQIAAWTSAYEIYLPKPPVPVQKALFAVLGPLARLRGYRPWYPEYSDLAEPVTGPARAGQ
jgi:mannose-6-phosphate isomerase-like protein (cupin superfamily)